MLEQIFIVYLDEYNDQSAEMNGDVAEPDNTPRMCDIIRITGPVEKCEAAKQALLDLVPVTVEIEVPNDLHRSIIGQKGRDVKELMQTYDVNITLSPTDEQLNVIKVSSFTWNFALWKYFVEECN